MFRIVFRGPVAARLAWVTYHYSNIGLDTGGVRNCCCLSDNTADRGFTTRWLRIVVEAVVVICRQSLSERSGSLAAWREKTIGVSVTWRALLVEERR